MSKLLTNLSFLRRYADSHPHRCICYGDPKPKEAEGFFPGLDFLRTPITSDHAVWAFRNQADLDKFKRQFKGFIKS